MFLMNASSFGVKGQSQGCGGLTYTYAGNSTLCAEAIQYAVFHAKLDFIVCNCMI